MERSNRTEATPIDTNRASSQRVALTAVAAGATVSALAMLTASIHPGPRAWGFHVPGFLPWLARVATLAVWIASAAALWRAALRDDAVRPKAREAAKRVRGKRSPVGGRARFAWIAALPAFGALLYALRARTHFLGDGIVWLNQLIGGTAKPFGEPLATAAWMGFASLLRGIGRPVNDASLALLPVACGIVSAAIAWGIVRETVEDRARRGVAVALWTTLGVSQLYFGYIESYPIVSVAILAYLWLAVRRVRGADPAWLPGVALGVAVATHMVTMVLAPSYIVVVVRTEPSWTRRLLFLALPLVAATALLSAAGTTPRDWIVPFQTATHGFERGPAGTPFTRPYPWLSFPHALDVANGIALAIPLPAIVLTAWGIARRGRVWPREPAHQVLGAAAAAGLLAAAALTLPVAPAQDWDLTAILLLPSGIAGIVAARSLSRVPLVGAALVAASGASLLAFVGVNANEAAGIRRYETLLSPGSAMTPYGRGYASSILSEYFEDKGELPDALTYAEAAIEAERTNPRYWMRAGTILYNLKRYEEAAAALEEALRRGITRSGAHHNLGLCYYHLGRPAEAVNQFRLAVAMEGDRPDYRQSLGVALFTTGRQDSARLVWTEVLERWPDYAPTLRSMTQHFGGTPLHP